MKKLISLLLALTIVFSLVSCGADTSSSGTPSSTPASTGSDSSEPAESGQTEGPALAADGRYPAETVKIGLETYTTTDEQFLAIQNYLTYLQEYFNIEIIYSEAVDSAEGELDFIEQCAAGVQK